MSLYLTIAASDRFWKTSFTAVCVCVDPPKIISYYPGQVIWADLLVHVCFGRYDAFWHIWCLIPQNQRGRLYVKCGLITVRYILIMIGRYMQECDIECSSGVYDVAGWRHCSRGDRLMLRPPLRSTCSLLSSYSLCPTATSSRSHANSWGSLIIIHCFRCSA